MIARMTRLTGGVLAGIILLIGLLVVLETIGAQGLPGPQVEAEPIDSRPEAPQVPPPPFSPVGTVKDQGLNVPSGTEIRAICDGVPEERIPSTQTVFFGAPTESWYTLDIPGDDPDTLDVVEGCDPGETIHFEIGGQPAYQTATWLQGDTPELDLTLDTPSPAIDLKILVAGRTAETPPGPYVEAGQPITWTYIVSSTGNVTLHPVEVMGDQAVPGIDETICSIDRLVPGTPVACYQVLTATQGLFSSQATAAGAFNGSPVNITSPGYYQGVVPSMTFSLLINGQDADVPPGPTVLVGENVTFTLQVTNTGGITLTTVAFRDQQDALLCQVAELGPGLADNCQPAPSPALAGQQGVIATAVGSPAFDLGVISDTDPGYYFGASPAIRLEKSTNGQDADQPPGPRVVQDSAISWRYVVSNTGNVTLTNIIINDDNGTPDNGSDDFEVCTITQLAAGASADCTKNDGLAILGQYGNLGLATTVYAGQVFSDSDPSHYEGVEQLEWFLFLPSIVK